MDFNIKTRLTASLGILVGIIIILVILSVVKLLQKSEMRKEIVIELSYKGFSRASDYS